MMLMTGMSISGKMSVAIFISTNGVASTISIAITMKVYGRLSASWTMDTSGELLEARRRMIFSYRAARGRRVAPRTG